MKYSLLKTTTMVLGLCVMLSGCVWLRSSAIADRAGSGGRLCGFRRVTTAYFTSLRRTG